MPRFTSPFDGAQLFYRDYTPTTNPAPYLPKDKDHVEKQKLALVFIHGWPMNSLMFEHIILPLCETHRFRCIAPDRRGFGKSDWNGAEQGKGEIDYHVFAQDTTHLLETLDIGPFVFVAASMGPGETLLAYDRSQYIRENCKGFLWVGPALPFPLPNPAAPTAPSREVWDTLLNGFRGSRGDFVRAALPASLSSNPAHPISDATMKRFEGFVEAADAIAIERCVQIITATDFTERLRKLDRDSDVAVLCVHGDEDAGCPYEASSKVVKEIVGRAGVKVYQGAAHGLYLTHREQFMNDLLEFVAGLK
ncbi:hypothetical protein FQN51_001595 [Onygenales sp. PD_10]|nr:hypothetical protein FQN51_001595 [Onygenales sp. PD_10]